MKPRLLGLYALIGAPFLFIDFLSMSYGVNRSVLDGLYSFLYISGWLCSIIGLWQIKATGENRWGRIVLIIQLIFLVLADISNIMLLLQVNLSGTLYFVLDFFWPVSNVWMLATGITIITAKKLQGWHRFIPLIVGCWFPFCMLISLALGKMSLTTMYLGGAYSAIAWTLLAILVLRQQATRKYLTPAMV